MYSSDSFMKVCYSLFFCSFSFSITCIYRSSYGLFIYYYKIVIITTATTIITIII
ncbi:uncharacterized protein BX664DRAFT_66641 [Halteromyces radiatus]|uniref:uncharacterized protein n=1 Tax=Halteromyces radiatus TaxID=101107 RepID=UPI0022210859|nr:uncharacterized protein BX664DRAFT_66641 [Halteromyces radiatus]KAI8096804.1 hypothetical protein BX664DRAFT_66641 [Halteromyces radiatus]